MKYPVTKAEWAREFDRAHRFGDDWFGLATHFTMTLRAGSSRKGLRIDVEDHDAFSRLDWHGCYDNEDDHHLKLLYPGIGTITIIISSRNLPFWNIYKDTKKGTDGRDWTPEFDRYVQLVRYREIMIAFFHEFVHYKQYFTGELRDIKVYGYGEKKRKICQSWKGVEYWDTEYWKRPWEKEAYDLSPVMFDAWLLETDMADRFRRDTNMDIMFENGGKWEC